jgi:hypothetical protein
MVFSRAIYNLKPNLNRVDFKKSFEKGFTAEKVVKETSKRR